MRNAPCAAAIVRRRDGRVALGRRGIEPWHGHWEIPGGFSDVGEHPASTAVREAQEELGLAIEITAWGGVYLHPVPTDSVWRMVMIYLARPADPSDDVLVPDGIEVTDAGWFDLHELPDPVVPGHLGRLLDVRNGVDPLSVGWTPAQRPPLPLRRYPSAP